MKKILTALLSLLPALVAAQPAEQVDDQSKLAPGVSRGVAFMCVNSADALDASDFGTVRCGSTRQLMVEAIQSGTWNVGTVTTLTGITNPVAVTVTFWQATQPVSGPLTDTQLRATAVPVSGTFWQATQPVSAASLPLPSGAATSANQATAITALQLIDNLPVGQGSTTSGQSGVLAQGAVTTAAPSYTTGQTSPLSLTTSGELRVAGSFSGGGDGALQDGAAPSIEATVLDYTNSNPLAVRLTDTSGDYVGAGGGTQYADGAAQATPTGTVALGHDGSNVRALTTDVSGDLQVDVLTMPTTTVTGTVTANAGTGTLAVSGPLTDAQLRATPAPVSGTVTANAGTNLNTSALLTTTAHDAAFGTAGAADAQVRTVQGIAGGTAIPVSGTFWQATQPVSIASAVTVAQATAANLNATVTDGTGPLTVDGTVTVTPSTAAANNDGACVSVTTASTAVLASFASRKWASIVNQGTAMVYLKFGATATASDFPLPSGAAFNWPAGVSYTGVVDAIASAGTQSVCVVEF